MTPIDGGGFNQGVSMFAVVNTFHASADSRIHGVVMSTHATQEDAERQASKPIPRLMGGAYVPRAVFEVTIPGIAPGSDLAWGEGRRV